VDVLLPTDGVRFGSLGIFRSPFELISTIMVLFEMGDGSQGASGSSSGGPACTQTVNHPRHPEGSRRDLFTEADWRACATRRHS
jgi:hypothetical protein